MESQNLENEDAELEDPPNLDNLRIKKKEESESERMKVLVVGGGLSGGMLSYFLKSKKTFQNYLLGKIARTWRTSSDEKVFNDFRLSS